MADLRIAIIGGTGLGDRLGDLGPLEAVDVDTPFGPPSGPILTGTAGDVAIALLSRHGEGHMLRPAAVPFRANIYALKSLGCTHVVGFGATGSLREEIVPGARRTMSSSGALGGTVKVDW